ncbi:type VII secretion protein EccB [Kitasatospora sp. NPDC048540]|uniref:type VII secretion protein EccB n=1 Tax=unclassified Kitasatospora TaxID=2633591 RepID=UPI00053ADA45|nr:type VII secretion protein EccB [Kitasatospora sp. MBT63]
MASRRDELNAYTFARKRMVGAFLQPSGGGNDEDAPRPVRAVLPSFVVAAVTVAGFGMWGVIKPAAPVNWDSGKYIVQAKQSTTRYVVLKDPTNGQMVLHQVLNMSSARLVLPAGAEVMPVADDVLDKYRNHGATIGIPYAPDRLPKAADAGAAKKWSVCDRPGNATNTQESISQSVFVAADKEAETLAAKDKMLADGQALFVQGPPTGGTPGSKYLVDSTGTRHAVGPVDTQAGDQQAMESALFGRGTQPQQVTDDWLRTLADGKAITFPKIPGFVDGKVTLSTVDVSSTAEKRVGRVLQFQDSFFVVGTDHIYAVTPLQAELILNDPGMDTVYDRKKPEPFQLTPSDNAKLAPLVDTEAMKAPVTWPSNRIDKAVNAGTDKGARSVVCSTFESIEKNVVKRSVWAWTDYPAPVSSGSLSAHVTPGHGLLYRAVDNVGAETSGSDFLITETGLRYSLPNNNDGPAGAAGASATPAPGGQPEQKSEANEAQARLGYKDIVPTQVPVEWSKLVPGGGVLNTFAALQAQNA